MLPRRESDHCVAVPLDVIAGGFLGTASDSLNSSPPIQANRDRAIHAHPTRAPGVGIPIDSTGFGGTMARCFSSLCEARNPSRKALEGGEPGLKWWSRRGSNPRPLECHSSTLPTELRPQREADPTEGLGPCQSTNQVRMGLAYVRGRPGEAGSPTCVVCCAAAAGVVKLVDAGDSKSPGRKAMRVRFPPPAPPPSSRPVVLGLSSRPD